MPPYLRNQGLARPSSYPCNEEGAILPLSSVAPCVWCFKLNQETLHPCAQHRCRSSGFRVTPLSTFVQGLSLIRFYNLAFFLKGELQILSASG